jgi:hypothetical protein
MTELEEIIKIIKTARLKITDDTELVWSGYDSVAGLQAAIDNDIKELIAGDLTKLDSFKFHFLPTSTFQEISLSNGWSEEYMELSLDFDKYYESIKNNVELNTADVIDNRTGSSEGKDRGLRKIWSWLKGS